MNGFDPVKQAEKKLVEITRAVQIECQQDMAASPMRNPMVAGQDLLNTGAFTWHTIDGHSMFIGEMSDGHLLNALKKRLREHRTEDDRFKYICYELARRAFFKKGGDNGE